MIDNMMFNTIHIVIFIPMVLYYNDDDILIIFAQ